MTSWPDAAASSARFISAGVRNLLDDQDVGIFAERRAGNRQHLVVVAADLALADERAARSCTMLISRSMVMT